MTKDELCGASLADPEPVCRRVDHEILLVKNNIKPNRTKGTYVWETQYLFFISRLIFFFIAGLGDGFNNFKFIFDTREFSKRVRMISDQLFVTLYTQTVDPISSESFSRIPPSHTSVGRQGQRTDTLRTNLSNDQRNPIENDHGIRPKKCCKGTIRSLASAKVFNDAIGPNRKFGPMTQFTFFYRFFSLLFLEFVSAQPPNLLYPQRSALYPNLAAALGPLACSSRSARAPSLLSLILSNAMYNLEIRFVAIIYY